MLKSLLKNTDYVVLVTVLLLFVIGVIAIFSAGYNTDVNKILAANIKNYPTIKANFIRVGWVLSISQ